MLIRSHHTKTHHTLIHHADQTLADLTSTTRVSPLPHAPQSMTRTLGAGGLGVSAVMQPLAGARVTCTVTGILVLYGLPRLLTGAPWPTP